jgi:hypothetical protein
MLACPQTLQVLVIAIGIKSVGVPHQYGRENMRSSEASVDEPAGSLCKRFECGRFEIIPKASGTANILK